MQKNNHKKLYFQAAHFHLSSNFTSTINRMAFHRGILGSTVIGKVPLSERLAGDISLETSPYHFRLWRQRIKV